MRHRRGCSPRGGMSAWKHVCLGLGIGAALGALLGRRPWHGPKQAPAAVQSRVVTVVRRPRTTGNHTVVMGQFNTRLRSATVAAWASAWSRLRLVDDVFVAVPISTTGAPVPWTPADLEADLSPYPAGKGLYVLTYPGDGGVISPSANLAFVIRTVGAAARGVMYVHDDMLVASSIIARLGNDAWITNNRRSTLRLYPNGSVVGLAPGWMHTPACEAGFARFARSPTAKPLLNASPFLVVGGGRADFLYVTTTSDEQVRILLRLLDGVVQARLFLECALPSVVEIMERLFDVPVYAAKLAQDPPQLKTVLDLIAGDSARRAHPIPELMHPIKLNMVGILPWVAAFEAATGLADGAP